MVQMGISTASLLGYDSLVCYLQVFASYFVRILAVCDASHPMGVSAMVILP